MYIRRAKYSKNTKIPNKVAIITGANTGIGKENAIDLAKRGAKVYIACRDIKRGEEALKEIKERSQSNKVYFLQLDLASLDSVREFAKTFQQLESKLHILINNAGVVMNKRILTKDDFEMTFATNHLGHFLLTNLLVEIMKASSPSRIINVSSSAHYFTDINQDDLMSEKSFGSFKAYAQSKLANVLFSRELSKKLAGSGVTVNSCHPGVVKTEILRNLNPFLRKVIIEPVYEYIMKTSYEGAQTQIRLAVDPELETVTGKYFADCEEAAVSKYAENDDTAEWLYQKSIKFVKL